MPLTLPPSPHPLRKYLLRECTPDRLRSIASADYGRDADRIAAEFQHNLNTGEYAYRGDGNPYECCLLNLHRADAHATSLNALFAAWWIGTFCSDPTNWVLIDNLGLHNLLGPLVRSSAHLGSKAAHAAVPFILFLRTRDPHPNDALYAAAVHALEAIEKLGPTATSTSRYTQFLNLCENPPTPG